ncbi:MAG: sugar phosphate isomerase/epimerase family protein [Lachnospiraceae bacterium]
MAEYYLCSTLMWNASLEEMFRFIYEQELDGIELWAQHWFTKGYSAEEYRRLAALYPVKIFIHSCSWDLNLASLNEGIRTASIQEVKKSIDLAVELDSYEVTVHPGRFTIPCSCDESTYYDRMYQTLKELLSYARKRNVDLSLEIMEELPKEFVTSSSAMKAITRDLVSEFYYTLDIAHCKNMDVVQKELNSGIRFSKFHISNRQKMKLHTPLPEGDYDFTTLLPELESYRIPFVIEGFDSHREFPIANKNIRFLKNFGGKQT